LTEYDTKLFIHFTEYKRFLRSARAIKVVEVNYQHVADNYEIILLTFEVNRGISRYEGAEE